MPHSQIDRYALLHRLNPKYWPSWQEHIISNQFSSVWFETGRLRQKSIHPGIPVVVLGTQGLGILAVGETETGIEYRSDPDWKQGTPNQQARFSAPRNRVRVKIKRVFVPLEEIVDHYLLRGLPQRISTTTWLSSAQHNAIISLIL